MPWLLLNVADPSSKQRIATDWDDGLGTVAFDGLQVSGVTVAPGSTSSGRNTGGDGDPTVFHSVPDRTDSTLQSVEYAWEPWDQPTYEERLKESYHVLRREMS